LEGVDSFLHKNDTKRTPNNTGKKEEKKKKRRMRIEERTGGKVES
jgi:hypothetical protein